MDSTTRKLLTAEQRAVVDLFEDGHDLHAGYSATAQGVRCSGASDEDGHDATALRFDPDDLSLRYTAGDETHTIEGARCTCTCLRPATHLEPAEWEQDPDCPVHPAKEAAVDAVVVDEPEDPMAGLERAIESYEQVAASTAWPAGAAALLAAGGELAWAAVRVNEAGLPLERLEACAATVEPWVDRMELLRIAAGKANNPEFMVGFAARLEAFVRDGSEIGQPLAESSAREVLADAFRHTDITSLLVDEQLAREVVELLANEGYALTKTTDKEA